MVEKPFNEEKSNKNIQVKIEKFTKILGTNEQYRKK